MKAVRIFSLFIALVSVSTLLKAQTPEIKINCEGGDCSVYEQVLKDTASRESSVDAFREAFRFLLQDEKIEYLDYTLDYSKDEIIAINARVKLKQVVGQIHVYSTAEIRSLQLERSLSFFEGDFDSATHCQEGVRVIEAALEGRGYLKSSVKCERAVSNEELINYIFRIKPGEAQIISSIKLIGDNESLESELRLKLRNLKGQPWDRVAVRVLVDEINQDFVARGFFDTKLEVQEIDEQNPRRVQVTFELKSGVSKRFSFNGNRALSRSDFIAAIQASAKQGFNTFNEKDYQEIFRTLYSSKGFPDAVIKIRKVEGLTLRGVPFINYYADIKEGKKAEIGNVSFLGNESFSDEELRVFFFENGSNLTDSNYLDRSYFEVFREDLKEKYLAEGFLFVEITNIEALYNERTYKYDIEVRINERQQVTLSKIVMTGLPPELEEKVAEGFSNRPGSSLNILSLEADLNRALATIKSEGYLYAKINIKNERELLNYSSNYTEAQLVIPFVTEKKVYLDSILVTGNRTTMPKVILRETKVSKGDVLTPSALQEIRDRLTILGLFSEVSVQTFVLNKASDSKVKDRYLANLLIQVKERDYGVLEVAPGYRTDLGLKLGTGITRNNIFGLDHSLSARAEGNYRLNYSSFDERRSREKHDLLEYEAKLNYRIPYLLENLFSNGLTFDISTSFQLRRFYGFDAYISRVAPQLSYTFNKYWSASLRYQFEHIDQFDATELKDDDNFTIGGLTPSISLDLRDDPINPRKGAAFGLSWEFANPAFGSMSEEDITINFSKIVQRNKFYIPFNDRWYLATSLSWGYQKNYADEYKRDADGNIIYDANGRAERKGYIPSLKVFRLDGIDAVRGYADTEINRLGDADVDIGDVIIDSIAYFVNVKIEPRYVLSDNMILGLFFDAGRVFREHFQPLSLRTSTGVSFKLMTPVGSLDFDYGFKLHRTTYDVDKKESFGRFHLTIGFF